MATQKQAIVTMSARHYIDKESISPCVGFAERGINQLLTSCLSAGAVDRKHKK